MQIDRLIIDEQTEDRQASTDKIIESQIDRKVVIDRDRQIYLKIIKDDFYSSIDWQEGYFDEEGVLLL